MVTGTQLVERAKSHLGMEEHPMGSNRGPFVQMCQAATFLRGTGWPWCAGFVCLVCKQCKVPLAYNGAGAHDLADHHKPWVSPGNAEAGMVLDVNEGSGHTCIIARNNHAAQTFDTINGNWGDKVSEVTFRWSQARAVWKVPGVHYQGGVAPHPKPSPPPKWVVTTSASGHKKVFRNKRGLIHYLQTHVFPGGVTISRPKNRPKR
jgi:hypothetical protein